MKYIGGELDHDWIVVLDPLVIPLKPLDELFHLFNTTVTESYGLQGFSENTLFAMSTLFNGDKGIRKSRFFT